MADSPDLEQFGQYFHLAEKLVAHATKEEVLEVARLLAINCAHYESRYGEQLLEQTLDSAGDAKPDAKTAKLLTKGMRNLCGFIAIVIGDTNPDGPRH